MRSQYHLRMYEHFSNQYLQVVMHQVNAGGKLFKECGPPAQIPNGIRPAGTQQ
jgi:hypothetical protein